jgi:head-tail adaptor
MARYGARRSLITVQSETGAKDSYGQSAKTWATVGHIRGLVRTPNGREIYDAGQRKAVSEVVVEAGRDAALIGLTPNHRLVIGSVQYSIEWLNDEDNKHRKLFIHCKQLVSPSKSL